MRMYVKHLLCQSSQAGDQRLYFMKSLNLQRREANETGGAGALSFHLRNQGVF